MSSIRIKTGPAAAAIASLRARVLQLDKIQEDLQFKQDMRTALAANFQQIWASQGTAIGSDWRGHTLVKSGRLRGSLTNTQNLVLRQVGDSILIGSSVSYAPYVNNMYRFYGITTSTNNAIGSAVGRFWQRTANTTALRQ